MPLSDFEKKNLAKAWVNEAPTKATSLWVQLHTGDPGKACTSNVATESKRIQITMKELAAGEWTNENVLEWAGLAATEEISHVSVWDAKEAGNARIYGELTAKEKLTKEKDARIKAEKLKLSLV
ncbi:MAG TPA: hypothetical protein VGC63_04935 [Solirubrobacterales bacterium]|jgi:hypothetical protein